ncbi:MAG: universal stress protein [Thermodesulfobacteriota bacterium]
MKAIKGIGICSIYSQQCDWALDYALSLARRTESTLNIYHILDSPYTFQRDTVYADPEKKETTQVTPELLAEKDRELRAKYEERLGSYPSVGFRLCEGNHEWELKKGYRRGEYDILVMGYPEKGAIIGGTTTIEKLAHGFHGPVVLVGPEHPHSFHVNKKAEEMLYRLNIPKDRWRPIEESRGEARPVQLVPRPERPGRRDFDAKKVAKGVLAQKWFATRLRFG